MSGSINQWLQRATAEREITEDVAEQFARFLWLEYCASPFGPTTDQYRAWAKQFADKLADQLDGL